MRPKLVPPSRGAGRHVKWRARCLREAGFEPLIAQRLARDPRIDLHALLELVDRGCQPELALRIAAPLDSEQGSP